MNQTVDVIIKMENVSYAGSRGKQPLLTGLTLDIPAGQWVSIAGKNGAGKSTFVRLINGLLKADGGRVVVDGLLLAADTVWTVRERVGIVFANPDNQFVGMTVAEDIVFGMENRCLPRDIMLERLRHYAELMKIGHLLERHPGELSGGQKQRVAIASVLAMEPKIVIFDEATSMLDEKSKKEIMTIINDMRAEGRYTIVSVTHDSEEMAASDRVIALSDGTIAADGRPLDVLRNDEVLERCRLKPPFLLQLCKELRKRGTDIGDHLDESEVLEALWEYNSKKSLTPILA